MLNIEYMRGLGAKELADLICGEGGYGCGMCENNEYICDGQCCDGIIAWLLQEHKEELKPCPFCGGKASVFGTEVLWVQCGCGASLNCYETEAEAIERWNRRSKHDD